MIRLNIVTEGQTELEFVNRVLKFHLAERNVFTSVRCVETSRDKRKSKVYRGGMLAYQRLKRDLIRWMKQDQDATVYFTTMIDLYALPPDFPDFKAAMQETDLMR